MFDEFDMQDAKGSYEHSHHYNQSIMEVGDEPGSIVASNAFAENACILFLITMLLQPCGDIRVKLTRLLKENQSWVGADGNGTNLPLHPNASIFIRFVSLKIPRFRCFARLLRFIIFSLMYFFLSIDNCMQHLVPI